MPVWGIWLDGMFYFSTGRRSRKSRNLAANPNCVICPEGASEALILEGFTEELNDSIVRREVRGAHKKKYDSELHSYSADPIYAVRPRVVFGLVESSDKIRGNPTRWRFSTS